MAEDQEGKEEDLSSDETTELEALLETAGGDGDAKAAAPGPKGKLQQILSNKKLLMLFGGGVLVLLIAIGVGVYVTISGTEEEVVPVEEEQAEKEITVNTLKKSKRNFFTVKKKLKTKISYINGTAMNGRVKIN